MSASTWRCWAPLLPVLAATACIPWIVPEPPWLHLDDPSHWGLLAFVLFVALLARRAQRRQAAAPRRLLALFLAGMPVVYVANWLRHGGSRGWLSVELVGVVLFAVFVWLGWARTRRWLAVGIAAHAVWDAAHLGRAPFVPDWYAIGCAVADIGMSAYAVGVDLLLGQAEGAADGG